MYRSLIVILTVITLIPATGTTLAAQSRGYHGGAGFRAAPPVRTAPVVVPPVRNGGAVFQATPPVRIAPGPAFIGRGPVPPFRTSPVSPFGHSPFGFGRFPRTIIVPPVVGYYSPYGWPAPLYGPTYSTYVGPAYSEPAYASPPVQSPAVSQAEVDLAYQVGRLSQEVDQLRQQQTLRQSPQSQSAPEQPPTPTVLVFRDGHRLEIQNYAIVGQTLWVLEEKSSIKISISDLDLEATQKENRSRGLRFPLPER